MNAATKQAIVDGAEERNQAGVYIKSLNVMNEAREFLSQRYSGLLRDGKRDEAVKLVAAVDRGDETDGPTTLLRREIRYLNICNRMHLGCASADDVRMRGIIERQQHKTKFDLYTFLVGIDQVLADKLKAVVMAPTPNAPRTLTREEAERIVAEDERKAREEMAKRVPAQPVLGKAASHV